MTLEASTGIPARCTVEVFSEPTPELFAQRLPSLVALLRMALLGGMEMALPTTLHLILDLCNDVVASERQLVVMSSESSREPRMQVSRHFTGALPDASANLINQWTVQTAKPIIVSKSDRNKYDDSCGNEPMDAFLAKVQARHALAVPLFLEHGVAGSLQLFREHGAAFEAADAQLLWILSLLAENQMARTGAIQNLLRMAFTDYLTGLKTRGFFEQALSYEIKRTLRNQSSCAVLLLDLDDFKQVNDRWGHHVGDEILRQFSRILSRDMREIDTVSRFGGDEFSVILPDSDQETALFVASRVREAVRNAQFNVPDLPAPLRLNVSIGAALCPQDESDPHQLLRAADLALYRAKREGKNRLYFSQQMRGAS